MILIRAKRFDTLILGFILLVVSVRCSRELSDCDGADLNVDALNSLKATIGSSGPRAFLVVPNPIEATQSASVLATDSGLSRVTDPFQLGGLMTSTRLENEFLKVRIKSIQDEVSSLATPNTKDGSFSYPVSDVHYSEVMAYYAVSNVKRYVEALGFPVIQNRPLYVMVRGNDEDTAAGEVNAYYLHNRRNTSLPREMILYGDTAHTPGVDRDVYWHEFGHLFNESVSGDVGIDMAGESGAVYSEGAALHECLADHLAESVSNRGYIGRWVAQNFSSVKAGDPLRSALKSNDDKNSYQNVANFDATGKNLDRYRLAEWCSRVLWDIRTQFSKESPQRGAFLSDRLVFSAVSLLKKDASMKQFREALSKADGEMYCGLHSKSIKNAFESRGYNDAPTVLSNPLQLSAAVNVYSVDGSNITKPTSLPGSTAFFTVKIVNPNSAVARNVRVQLEAVDENLVPIAYSQSYGDLPAGATILTTQANGLDPMVYGVNGGVPTNSKANRIKYRLKVVIDNGPTTTNTGDFGL